MSKRIIFILMLIALLSLSAVAAVDADPLTDNQLNLTIFNHDFNNGALNDGFKKEFDLFEYVPTFDSVDLYNDGENVSVRFYSLNPTIDVDNLNDDIIDYTFEVMEDPKANITTLKDGIRNICSEYGVDDVKINVDSVIGEDEIPVIFTTEGDSMLPTIKSGDKVLVNKSHNIHVGNLVSANSSEYGPICKRVADIDGDSVYLVSDNKKVTREYYDDYYVEYRGITTWVNIDDIDGVIIDIMN